MKKKILLIVCILSLVCAAAMLSACDKTGEETLPSDISRSVDALYSGGDDAIVVTVEKGMREDPFIADGKASGAKEFAEISVTPLTVNDYEELTYVLSDGTEGGRTLSGTLTPGSFGEFKGEVLLDFVPVSVSVTAGEQTTTIALADVLAGKLSCADAINVAKKQFAERIAAEEAEGRPAREVYVKLITGDRETYYYYVSLIGEGTDYWAALIDPTDGRIVSAK